MAEIKDLSTTDDSNNLADYLGWPENMPRTAVNDRARELLGAIRRFYEDGEWTDLLSEQNGPAYTITKASDASIEIASVPSTDASGHFPAGARVRVSVSGASAVEAEVVSTGYSAGTTTVNLTFPALYRKDTSVGSTSGLGTAAAPSSFSLGIGSAGDYVAGTLRISDSAAHVSGGSVVDSGGGTLDHLDTSAVGSVTLPRSSTVTINGLAVAFDAAATVTYQYKNFVTVGANKVETYFNHSASDSAFRQVGMSGGKVLLYENVGDAAFAWQGAGGGLDADKVDGYEAQALAMQHSNANNLLINPAFAIWQRGGEFSSDATNLDAQNNYYTADQWLLLTEAADNLWEVHADVAEPATGMPVRLALEVGTGHPAGPNSDKGGLFQPLDFDVSHQLRGQTVSFSVHFKASAGASFPNVAAGVYSWTNGGANSDFHWDSSAGHDGGAGRPVYTKRIPFSAWGATGINPTVTGEWSLLGSVERLASSTSWQRLKVEGVTVPDGCQHLMVGVWIDDKDLTVGHQLHLAQAQLEVGAFVSDWAGYSLGDDFQRCLPYCYSSKTLNAIGEPDAWSPYVETVTTGTATHGLHAPAGTLLFPPPGVGFYRQALDGSANFFTLHNPSDSPAGEWLTGGAATVTATGASAENWPIGIAGGDANDKIHILVETSV